MVTFDGSLGKDTGTEPAPGLAEAVGVGTVEAGDSIFKENCPIGSVPVISAPIPKVRFKAVSSEVGTFMEIVTGLH